MQHKSSLTLPEFYAWAQKRTDQDRKTQRLGQQFMNEHLPEAKDQLLFYARNDADAMRYIVQHVEFQPEPQQDALVGVS